MMLTPHESQTVLSGLQAMSVQRQWRRNPHSTCLRAPVPPPLAGGLLLTIGALAKRLSLMLLLPQLLLPLLQAIVRFWALAERYLAVLEGSCHCSGGARNSVHACLLHCRPVAAGRACARRHGCGSRLCKLVFPSWPPGRALLTYWRLNVGPPSLVKD